MLQNGYVEKIKKKQNICLILLQRHVLLSICLASAYSMLSIIFLVVSV